VQTAVQSKLQKAMDLWDLGVSLQKRTYTSEENQAAVALGITPLQNRLMEMARFGDTTIEETALRAMNGEELAKHIREHQETINGIATSLRATLQASMETIKAQFQEQIQSLQGQVDAIRNQGGNTATLQASLDAVKLQLRTILQAAIQELATQTEALRTQLNTQYQARLDQYEAIVNVYKQAHGIE
jgi:phage-related protein